MQTWSPEEADHILRRDALDAVIARPDFQRLARGYVTCWLPKSDDSRLLEITMRDLGRLVSGYWALYLDASPGGLTLSRLSKLLEGTALSSPGRARALLLYLRFLGYIEPDTGQRGDGREKRFRPTAQMKEAVRERLRRDFAALRDGDPALAAMADRLEDETLFSFFNWAHGAFLAAQFKVYRVKTVSLDTFSSRYSGMMMLARMLLSGEPDDQFPPIRPVSYTVAGLARDAGLSRAQVRRLLGEAEREGFMVPAGEGRMTFTPLFAEHFNMFAAAMILIYSVSAEAAFEHLDRLTSEVA